MSKEEKKPKFFEPITNSRYSTFNEHDTPYEEEEELSQNTEYYDRLNVHRDSSEKEIKNKYKKLSSEYHPDRRKVTNDGDLEEVNEGEDFNKKQTELNSAKDVLLDPHKRLSYDLLGNHSKSLLLSSEKDPPSLDIFKLEVKEWKKVIRKRYVEILSNSTSDHVLTIDSRFGIPRITEAESKSTFSFPLGKFDILKFTSISGFQITGSPTFIRGLQYRHYFKNKKSGDNFHPPEKGSDENIDKDEREIPLLSEVQSPTRLDRSSSFLSAEARFLFSHALLLLEAQRVINEEDDFRVKISNNFILLPIIYYLGFDINVQRKVMNPFYFRSASEEKVFSSARVLKGNPLLIRCGFSFPIFRRVFYTGVISKHGDARVSLGLNSLRCSTHYDIAKLGDNLLRLEASSNFDMKSLVSQWPDLQLCLFMVREVYDKYTHVGVGASVDNMYGLSLRGYFNRNLHHFSFPVFIPMSIKGIALGVVCPMLLIFGTKFFIRKYSKKKEREDWMIWKDRWWISTAKEREKYLRETEAFQEEVGDLRREELERDGLVILEARYGCLETKSLRNEEKDKQKRRRRRSRLGFSSKKKVEEEEEEEEELEGEDEDEDVDESDDEKDEGWVTWGKKKLKHFFGIEEERDEDDEYIDVKECWIDVTSSLQYHVNNGKLILSKLSKSHLEGFYDPCPDFEGKELYVRYTFQNQEDEITIVDEETLNLPLLYEFKK